MNNPLILQINKYLSLNLFVIILGYILANIYKTTPWTSSHPECPRPSVGQRSSQSGSGGVSAAAAGSEGSSPRPSPDPWQRPSHGQHGCQHAPSHCPTSSPLSDPSRDSALWPGMTGPAQRKSPPSGHHFIIYRLYETLSTFLLIYINSYLLQTYDFWTLLHHSKHASINPAHLERL